MTFRPMWKVLRKRSDRYLEFIRGKPCIVCGSLSASHPHHIRISDSGGGGGTALKPSDYQAIPLCSDCHRREHQDPFIREIIAEIFFKVVAIMGEYVNFLEENSHGRKFLPQKRGHQGPG